MSFILHDKKYNYDRLLGSGGNGTVHLVHDDNGVQYAAKVSTDEPNEMIEDMLAENPDYQGPNTSFERVEVEAKALKYTHDKLNGHFHPNLVYYVDSGVLTNTQLPAEMRNSYDEDVMVIIESYVDGPTVGQIRNAYESGQDKEAIDIFKLMTDLLSALYTLETIKVKYYDLSDENIIYDARSNNFVIIDFGDVMVDEITFAHYYEEFSHMMESSLKSSVFGSLIEVLLRTYKNNIDPRFETFRLATEHTDNISISIRIFSEIFAERNVVIYGYGNNKVTIYRNGKIIAESDTDLLIPNLVYESHIVTIRDKFKKLGVTLNLNTNYRNYEILDVALSYYQGHDDRLKRIAKEVLSRYGIIKNYISPTDMQSLSIDTLIIPLMSQ
jgi:serine/threonine protein kinase